MTTTSSSPIFGVPIEVAEHALALCHPFDVASFARTCRSARNLVYFSGDHLWRQLFLLYPFDDPRKSLKARDDPDFMSKFDWRGELQRRIMVEEISSRQREQTLIFWNWALDTFVSLVEEALPLSKDEQQPSHNMKWLARILHNSPLLDVSFDPAEVQLFAQLKSCIELSLDDLKSNARLVKNRSASRCYVYDLRNYRFDNKWGPFLNGGRVNWVHVEAILNVIRMNISELPERWLVTPAGFQSIRPYSAPDCLTHDERDWAGVGGTWRRCICFMSYSDWFDFNYARADNRDHNRDQYFFERPGIREATRLIELNLQIIPLEAMQFRNRVPPEFYLPWNKKPQSLYPPLCFSGFSRGAHNHYAGIEGTVMMGVDGVVRWQFTLIFDGHTQWCSEGVQVANVASAAGVVGVWTGVHHSPGDPVGPFWMWKVRDGDEMLSV